MSDLLDRVGPERLWALVVGGLTAVLALGSLVAPRQVFDGFLWRYFWGPVVADGQGARCAIREDGSTRLVTDAGECAAATGVVAEPGYTTVSTASYAVVLILLLIGVYFLVRRLDVGDTPSMFFALFPFMLFGGALRVVEDAGIALQGVPDAATVPFPYSALLISPFIYFTVFALTVVALVASVLAANRGVVDRYEYPLAGAGTVLFLLTIGYLGFLAATTEELRFVASVPLVTLVGATITAGLVWVATERWFPEVNAGTRLMGPVIVWGHAVDGFANVLSLDWATQLGIPNYAPKHIVNAAIREYTAVIQPAWLTDAIGSTWPFIPVTVLAATLVVWVFNEEVFEDNPRYAIVLLIAVLAVGLGPGTRDFLRATLAI